jgi:hypothetical protein
MGPLKAHPVGLGTAALALVLVAALLMSSRDRAGVGQAPDPCREARGAADTYKAEALAVEPSPVPTPTTTDMFSGIGQRQAEVAASAAAKEAGRSRLRLYVAVVGQNARCFSVQERAEAEVMHGWLD